MAVTISSPRFSFVQFNESDLVQSCQFNDIHLCLPVFDKDDVSFQFVINTDTVEEADGLCDIANDKITLGIVSDCEEDFLIEFPEKPERYRIGEKQILYLWEHGLTDFDLVIDVAQCFLVKIKVTISVYEEYEFCSNCFQRIGDSCHTSVIEFGNEDNAFGFNYCYSGEDESEGTCEPTFIQFTNKETLIIPYTTSLQNKYGILPTVQVWIYDVNGELTDMGIRAAFDTYPPTEIRLDFGGPASGVIKIS